MAQVLAQGVLWGGTGNSTCGSRQITAWGPLAASAALRGRTRLLGFCLSELSAPGPRRLLHPNEAAGSLHCSTLCKRQDGSCACSSRLLSRQTQALVDTHAVHTEA